MTETINFKQLIDTLSTIPISSDVLHNILLHLQEQNLTLSSSSSFISEFYQSILTLERWAWQLLSQNYQQWLDNTTYQEFFQTLALFNKNLVFSFDNIDAEMKVSLLIPENKDWIYNILEQIKQIDNENEKYITIVSLWLDNLSYFFHDIPQFNTLPIIIDMSNYITCNFIMTDQFKLYLNQFQQLQETQMIVSEKQLFFLRTCSFFLNSCLISNNGNFSYSSNQIIEHIGENYLKIIEIYTQHIESWNEYILTVCTHLIGLICSCCWREGGQKSQMEILLSTEEISCNHVQNLIRIISYKPFYNRIIPQRSNNVTILLDTTLFFLINIIQSLNLNWYFRSMVELPDTLLIIAETTAFDKICLCAYGVLGEILTDEQLKDLKIVGSVERIFFTMLEHAWNHPSKKYKQVPIFYLLRGFLSLTKSDTIQQKLAASDKLLFFIGMCDEYPIVYDILWALSFNHDIRQQLRSNSMFMTKLVHLPKECNNDQLRKTIHGILWNLESNREVRTIVENQDEKTFDIMISYSHKDEVICRRIYDELVKSGYRVWIDFDQMHGNIMDAMAQAIERSNTVVICMSEPYRRSNYCRAEAHYAFQQQLKIVPVLVQEHYRPDGWLLFLIGQLLYVNFTKHEFMRAVEMLFKELDAPISGKIDKISTETTRENDSLPPVTQTLPPESVTLTDLPENILDWSQTHVHDWLIRHNLTQMSRLLANCDGRSLVYLNDFIKYGETREILSALKEDSRRRTNENISLIELSCFRSLMDQQKYLLPTTHSSSIINTNTTKLNIHSILPCRIF